MVTGLTPSEKFVSDLCHRSFLRLWTHPNPKGKKGKELCDCLIVCGPHVVIISVKDNEYRETGDETGWERWTRVALEKSFAQIYGAERWLDSADCILRADGREVSLPERSSRQYHRVAVALGAHGEVPLKWGDTGKGFVHVCDEYSVSALFKVLNTITDFIEFLRASEELIREEIRVIFSGGIEDLVALYIQLGNSFKFNATEGRKPDLMFLHDDLWHGFINSENFKVIQKDLENSYVWDNLIENFADDLLTGGMFNMHSNQVNDNDLALVVMALQPRAYRAVLAESFLDFYRNTNLKSAARVVQGYADSAFVFVVGSSENRAIRIRELSLRCLVVRGRLPGVKTVVGIATDRPGSSTIGYSSDIVYLHMPTWEEKNEIDVQGIQQDLGYFKEVTWKK